MRLSTKRGADHPLARFSAEEAAAICKRFAAADPRPSIRALARELSCAPETINKLVKHISYRK
jgi:hypothetical protein